LHVDFRRLKLDIQVGVCCENVEPFPLWERRSNSTITVLGKGSKVSIQANTICNHKNKKTPLHNQKLSFQTL
jgi:hypothetical protein